MPAVTGREHVPHRPSWDCWACGKDWPCNPAREDLAATMDRVVLAMFMGDRMVQAAHDMLTVTPEELFERFLDWTRHLPDR